MAKNIFTGFIGGMKIFSLNSQINPITRRMLKEHIRNFDNMITKGHFSKIDKIRNKWGLPIHSMAAVALLYNFYDWSEPIISLFWAIENYGFVQFIRNINKRKAAMLSEYLKTKGVREYDEIKYAVKKYFTELGMPLYPITHPKGMKQIVDNGTYPKSFETGILYARTDKKSLLKIIYSKNTSSKSVRHT